jgi:4-amino-4-deoxy-L-arabinose transferase-like glycosyltransferase
MKTISLRIKISLAVLASAVYVAGLFVPVMDIDASTYAFMSRVVASSAHFWKALLEPPGFLDKPPLLFFLSALSFKTFGVSTFAYKLPSLLVILLGFYSTFRLGSLLYDRRTGTLAAVMLCCCQGFIFFTNDVRTDALLAGMVIFAVWQLAAFLKTKRAVNFFGGFCGIALAMLAKGPLGLVVPAVAIGSFIIASRNWRLLFKWYWIAGLLLTGALLMPMLIGLYREYGWYGIRSFFWTQSFGRITGESQWNNGSDYFFFVHTFLWSFLPWSFFACYAVAEAALRSIKNRFRPACASDVLLLGGTIIPFAALSLSHYKLPHYIFPLFPFFAVLTARTIHAALDPHGAKGPRRYLLIAQITCCTLGALFGLYVLAIVFPCRNIVLWPVFMAPLIAAGYYCQARCGIFVRTVVAPCFAILGVNLILNGWFYPHLLSYQGGSNAAAVLQRRHAPTALIRDYRVFGASADFYTGTAIPAIDSAALRAQLTSVERWIYTDSAGRAAIAGTGKRILSEDSFPNYRVSMVTPRFLYYKTRPAEVRTRYVLHTLPE